jgi:SOS response regulatory protein OraA/RecX
MRVAGNASWVRTPLAVVLLGTCLLTAACTGAPTPATSSAPTAVSLSAPAASPSPERSKAEESNSSKDSKQENEGLTPSRENAIETALSYLDVTAFSRAGLIDQLKFEGFSKGDATYAVDAIDVDWSDQALLKAVSYLESSSFSESGLIDQLEYEGFTSSQARYGVQQAFESEGQSSDDASGNSVSRQNAVDSALSYLEYTAFSRTGLIEQLKYEGYSDADATYAVDSIDVNWNEQAAKSAESYLDFTSFSRSGLVDQLMYEGFTRSQAELGASAVGL